MSRYRTVIDNPAAHWPLVFHDAKGVLCAEEYPGQICIDNALPLLESEFIDRNRWGTTTGIVEE